MFTVVIPTRNRADTLLHCLETCVAQQRDDLRILVSDNMSADGTREVIAEFERRDARVRYATPGRRLSLAQHHEFALDQCPEGHVTVIGDDDGLIPGGFDEADRLLKEHPSAKALVWRQSDYLYPESPYTADLGWPSNTLSLAVETGSQLMNSRETLGRVLSARSDYFTLPGAYHSMVDAGVLRNIRRKSGGPAWILDPAPDLYVYVAVSLSDIPYAYTERSITLRGASRHSVGAAYSMPHGNKAIAEEFLSEAFPTMHPDWNCPRRPILTILHSCLARAVETGLTQEPLPVDWRNVLTAILVDLKTAGLESFAAPALPFVRGIAQRLGEEDWFLEVKDRDFAALRALLARDSAPAKRLQLKFEAADRIGNIRDACNFAGMVYATPALKSLARSSRDQIEEQKTRERLQGRHDQLRSQHARLKSQHQQLKEKCVQMDTRYQALKRKLGENRFLKFLEKLRGIG